MLTDCHFPSPNAHIVLMAHSFSYFFSGNFRKDYFCSFRSHFLFSGRKRRRREQNVACHARSLLVTVTARKLTILVQPLLYDVRPFVVRRGLLSMLPALGSGSALQANDGDHPRHGLSTKSVAPSASPSSLQFDRK